MNLKELSAQLGLSQTTVSRALNGFPEVSEKTRKRVEAAARAAKYRPSPSAAHLATGKTRVIGHVIPTTQHRMINPHFSDFLAGASEAYAEAGYDMLLRAAEVENEAAVYEDFVERKRVGAVVVHGPKLGDHRIELLKSLRMPFIVHGRTGEEDGSYPWLDVNNHGAFETATDYLIGLGHRRIALINGLDEMTFAAQRKEGYYHALERAGLEPDPAIMFSADMVEPYGYEATLEVLAAPRKPTAILCASVLCAMGSVRALSEKGLRPGQDISVMTFDDVLSFLQPTGHGPVNSDFMGSAFSGSAFTSMRSSIYDAGRRVGEILINSIEGTTNIIEQEEWTAELIEGRTTGPATS
ncbi:MAG: substrate-binding domain-containing protein [Pseudomonadota bacterium]